MIAVFDIDGTLADISERMEKAGAQPHRQSDPEAFQKWLDSLQCEKSLLEDKTIPGMTALVTAMNNVCETVYLTGRQEQYRDVTRTWLNKHGFPAVPLYMRPHGNEQCPSDYKASVLKKIEALAPDKQLILFDDDPDAACEKAYRDNGWTHLKAMWNAGLHKDHLIAKLNKKIEQLQRHTRFLVKSMEF